MKIILDCDPGHDDAIALMLALASPEIELLGVTTVHGNQTLEKTTINALKLLEFAGRAEIPVAAGADRPFQREPYVAAYVHGESGMDGPTLPQPTGSPVDRHAVGVLRRHRSSSDLRPRFAQGRDGALLVHGQNRPDGEERPRLRNDFESHRRTRSRRPRHIAWRTGSRRN